MKNYHINENFMQFVNNYCNTGIRPPEDKRRFICPAPFCLTVCPVFCASLQKTFKTKGEGSSVPPPLVSPFVPANLLAGK